jgi:dipeptidyl aminopeptidase/acylaminoacyl peptidase
VYQDDEFLRLDKPTYFTLQGEDTKRSGFAVRLPSGEFQTLAYDDQRFAALRRIREGDRFLFSLQSFSEAPGFYVTNGRFEAVKPVLRTNPQQSEFAWGKTQLVSYKSRWGMPLQGVLVYPAVYRQGSTYPMVTVIYERQSDGLHSYRFPSETDPYNVQMLSQRGYFVFLPDIAYRTGNPGLSAVDCLEPALDAVLRLRAGVDPQRIGLAGHSWGAYQTVFVLTKSKRFRVGVAGAPLTELISMSNSFYWNTGVPNVEIFEASQGRMGVPWWDALQQYMANSPLFQVQGLQAPLMVVFGDEDGAVDWHQGQYLYNTLRRMGKPLVMVVYRGENHFPAKRSNQLDFTRRAWHFLDVHLKGAKPEAWVTQGQPLYGQ